MSLSDEERRIMVELEMERAEKITEQFETLRKQQYWDTLVNRMYYAIFHAVSALMIHNAISIHTHRGALNAFNKEFVRSYNCFVDATEEEIVPLIEPLKVLIEKIKAKISE